jgi:hypothetical protein
MVYVWIQIQFLSAFAMQIIMERFVIKVVYLFSEFRSKFSKNNFFLNFQRLMIVYSEIRAKMVPLVHF